MRKPGWYSIILDPTKALPEEKEGFGCKHCNKPVEVPPMADPASMGGRCTVCDGLICPACVGKGCDVMERKLERIEAKARFELDRASWL